MPIDLRAIKRARLDAIQGQETINQIEHVASAGARLVYQGALVPGDVLTNDFAAAAVLVGVANILRIQVAGDTYIAFGDDTLAAVTAATSPALKLPAGYHIVVATDLWMRSSGPLTRVEVVSV